MRRKSVAAVVIWYFLTTGIGGRLMRQGPFANRIACETYRMRAGKFARTSECIAARPTTKKK
jgi:hypothetical protein